MELLPHPSNAPGAPRIEANVERAGDSLIFTFSLTSDNAVLIPPPTEPSRADELWQTTCFEAFIGGVGTRYSELNFSPSGQWAVYDFDRYRSGRRPLDIADPKITFDGMHLVTEVSLAMPSGAPLGLSAIVETIDGAISYWALAHPAAGPPDFHDPDCFVAKLP